MKKQLAEIKARQDKEEAEAKQKVLEAKIRENAQLEF